jgi:hypothetical protein
MKKPKINGLKNKIFTTSVHQAIAGIFILTGVTIGCVFCFFKHPIPIKTPEILLLGTIFILLPLRSKSKVVTLQKLSVFYVVSVLMNELAIEYFQISFGNTKFSISMAVVILPFFLTGFIIGQPKPLNFFFKSEYKELIFSWVLTVAVIILHMVLLFGLLNHFYGYGFEQNMTTMGHLCLYVIVFTFLWESLSAVRPRQILGIVTGLLFLAVVITRRLI